MRHPVNFANIPGNRYAAENLPPDYDTLSPAGQKMARVNSVSLVDTPTNAVASWNRFVKYYLTPDEELNFDPGFFKPPHHPASPLHFKLVDWMHRYKRVAVGAPRHCAKSTMRRSICLWKVLTKHRYDACSILAKDEFVVENFFQFKSQLESNNRIFDDFGDMRPPRGSGIWHNHLLTLANGSILRGISIQGRSRGLRPDLVWLDDPEYDEDYVSDNRASNIEELKEKTLGVFLPMLDGPGVLVFTNTMVALNSLGYHIVKTRDDPRFRDVQEGGTWFRMNVPAVDELGNNIWRHRYTPEFLRERESEMGTSLFRREYMGQPGSGQDSPFQINPTLHHFELSDPLAVSDPWNIESTVTYHEVGKGADGPTYTPQTSNLRELFGPMRRVLTVDYAEGLSSSHDYSAITVGALDNRNTLWVLDTWQGRVRSPVLAEQVWKMGQKWRVNQIAVESVSTQMEVYRIIKEWGAKHEMGGSEWMPSMIPLRYPAHLSKEARIMGLEWRFNQGRIKFGTHLRSTRDGQELMRQVEVFTPDGKGLAHDDLIDSVAMLQFVMRAATEQKLPAPTANTIENRILSGQMYYEGTTIPLSSGLDLRNMPLGVLMKLLENVELTRKSNMEGDQYDPHLDFEMPLTHTSPAFRGLEL